MMSTCKHDGGRPGRVVNLGIRIDWTCWKNTLQFSRCLKFCWCSLGYCLWLGGGNSNIFWNFHPDPWRNDPNWYFYFHSPSYIFVRWVGKQPPTSLYDVYPDQRATLFKTPAFFSTPWGVDTPNFSHQLQPWRRLHGLLEESWFPIAGTYSGYLKCFTIWHLVAIDDC